MAGDPPDTFRAAYDGEAFRRTAHAVVDRLADYLNGVMRSDPGGLPVLPWMPPAEAAERWTGFLAGPAEGIEPLLARAVAGATHLHSPRCLGHQVPPVLPAAAVSDLVVSLLNNSMTVYEMGGPGAAMERAAVEWMAGVLCLGDRADGVLTSGGSIGNLTALLAARQSRAGFDAWTDGLAGERPLAVLGSAGAHYSIARALQVMGLGEKGFYPVPIDAQLRLRPDALEEVYSSAERDGRRVFAVVASACATAGGTFDPLEEIADFCVDKGLWLHVDGAHGAAAALSPRYRHLVAGIERADSVVWDAHKLLLVPSLVTGVLFREGADSYAAFDHEASYLYDAGSGREWYNLSRRTLECTKPVLALRLWAALAAHGPGFYTAYVEHVFDLARWFARRIQADPDFELAIEPESNIVVFRFSPGRFADPDAGQAAIRRRIIESGAFYLTQARLPGGLHLRTVLMNPLTTEDDLEGLLGAIRRAAAELAE